MKANDMKSENIKDEESTFSENLMEQKSWSSWMKENRIFLGVIGCLCLTSMSLLVYNQHNIKKSTPVIISAPQPTQPKRKKINKTIPNPLSAARTLYHNGHADEAISRLLKISKDHPKAQTREASAALAKQYYQSLQTSARMRKIYLEGYVLYTAYPELACKKWDQILKAPKYDDPYYKKARRRFHQDCLTPTPNGTSHAD